MSDLVGVAAHICPSVPDAYVKFSNSSSKNLHNIFLNDVLLKDKSCRRTACSTASDLCQT